MDAAFWGALGVIVGAVITASGLLLTARWKIAETNVLQQRAKWRDEMRDLVERSIVETDAKELRRIAAGIALRTNPEKRADKDDRHLVALVGSLRDPANRDDRTRGRIVALAAHILKHDWTRAKWETKIPGIRGSEPSQTAFNGLTTYVSPTWVQTGKLFGQGTGPVGNDADQMSGTVRRADEEGANPANRT